MFHLIDISTYLQNVTHIRFPFCFGDIKSKHILYAFYSFLVIRLAE